MKILAVDTDGKALKELKKCLESIYSDSEIKMLSDPLMAVKYGYNNHIDVIYTEVDMKGMNGFDMTRLISQKQTGKISVIFVTRSNDYRDDAMNWGVDGYILKPICKEKLEKEDSQGLPKKYLILRGIKTDKMEDIIKWITEFTAITNVKRIMMQ